MFGLFRNNKAKLSFLLLALVMLLAACGGNGANGGDNQAANSPEPTVVPTAAQAEEAGPRTFKDARDRVVELPDNPQRIIGHYYASELTALGLPMVGTNYLNAKLILSDEQLASAEDVGGEGIVPNMEKVLSLSPDLILVPDFIEPADIDKLAQIAPTVVISYSSDVFSRLRTIAEIVGQPKLADNWINAYQAKAEQKRNELQPVLKEGETASAFVIHIDKKFYLYGPQRLGPTMYDALGFKTPAKVAELFAAKQDSLWEEISLELLEDYAADRIFLVVNRDNADVSSVLEELEKNPIWANIPAVKNGQAYVVGPRWALNDPLTLDWLLDEMTALITKS
jgi:iron complex transport system substrate-binding protein